MEPRKITHVSIKSSNQEIYPTRHSVKITLDDKTTKSYPMDGLQLAKIIGLTHNINMDGPNYPTNDFKVENQDRNYLKTFTLNEVLASFNNNFSFDKPNERVDVKAFRKN